MLGLAATAALAGGTAWTLTRAARAEAGWEARHPPDGDLVEVEGRRVHVRVSGRARGTAPDLVLIHGANGHLRDFASLTPPLEAAFRVLAVDRPGLGWSDSWGRADSDPQAQARILRRALSGFGLRRPIVLGHSYGGAVAMGWALEAPEDTAALVILAGATYPWPGEFRAWYRAYGGPLGWPARAAVAAFARDRQAARLIRAVFAPDPVPRGYLAQFGPGLSMRRAVQAASTRQVCALKGHLARMCRDYPGLALPIELVHGSHDRIVWPGIHAGRMAREVASARLEILEGVGHMPHHARPRAVLAAIHRAAGRAGLEPAGPPLQNDA